MILNEYKNNIRKNEHFKVSLYTEVDLNNKEHTYMSLEFDSKLYNGSTVHANIPKIDFMIFDGDTIYDNISKCIKHIPKFNIEFETHLVKDSFITITDITPCK